MGFWTENNRHFQLRNNVALALKCWISERQGPNYFSMLILSLPLLQLGIKSTSLRPGFIGVLRPRQFDMICWELDLISGFFAFSWLIIWVDKFGWCLAGGRDVDSRICTRSLCKLVISWFFTVPHLIDCLICTRNPMSIVLLLQMMVE